MVLIMVRFLFIYFIYSFFNKIILIFFNKNNVNSVNNDRITENIQGYLTQKFEKEKKKLEDKGQLYNNLQEKYDDLTNKYNEETNQHQIIVENLKKNIKEIEDKYLKNTENLKNDIKEIEDKYLKNTENLKNDIKEIEDKNLKNTQQLEQQIIQLKQSLESKENQLQSLEKEREVLAAENDSLYQKNTNLVNQLENTLFEDELSNQLGDIGQNYIMDLNDDISKLNNNLKKYITDLKQDVIVNIKEIRQLLLLYKCPIEITNQKDDLLIIQAVLQRHIIETIFSYATKYFQSTGQHYHLESDIINKASLLTTLLADASKYRTGNDEITRVTSTKLRKQIYLILNDCGFSDIYGKSNTTYEHPFITFYKEKLNKIMNELRIIKDQEKIAVENLAATIIREVIKIFWFRLKIYEHVQYVWIPYGFFARKIKF
jgi:hypothetical protein